MNRNITRACKMIADGKTLADVRAFLEPHAHCTKLDCEQTPVVREAWHAALHQAKLGPRRKQPKPQRSKIERVPRQFRSEKRNAMFGRKPIGNSKPADREVIRVMWAASDRGRAVPRHGSGPVRTAEPAASPVVVRPRRAALAGKILAAAAALAASAP